MIAQSVQLLTVQLKKVAAEISPASALSLVLQKCLLLSFLPADF
jgi:hypothetical protein